MTPKLPPKYRGMAWVIAIAIVSSIAMLGVPATSGSWGRRPAGVAGQPSLPDDAEKRRIDLAIAGLRRLGEQERARPVARPPGSQRIVALHVPGPVIDAQSLQPAIDFSRTSLVILQTARGAFAVVDGTVVHPGQSLPGGERLRGVDRNFLVLEDRTGRARRIELKDGFDAPAPPIAPALAPTSSTSPASPVTAATSTPPTPSTPAPTPKP